MWKSKLTSILEVKQELGNIITFKSNLRIALEVLSNTCLQRKTKTWTTSISKSFQVAIRSAFPDGSRGIPSSYRRTSRISTSRTTASNWPGGSQFEVITKLLKRCWFSIVSFGTYFLPANDGSNWHNSNGRCAILQSFHIFSHYKRL